MFHKHQYKEIARTICKPVSIPNREFETTQSMANKMLFGETTILWECAKCLRLRKETLSGVVIN